VDSSKATADAPWPGSFVVKDMYASWLSPPDSCAGQASAFSAIPTLSSSTSLRSSAKLRAPADPARCQRHVVQDRQMGEQVKRPELWRPPPRNGTAPGP
jgi:hypothetical protein